MATIKMCEQCGKAFEANRSDARFCSAACKQAHHRAEHAPADYNKWENVRQGRAKAVETLRAARIERTCPICGRSFEVWGTQMNTIYCSDACKMKAYRARKQASEQDRAGLLDLYLSFKNWESLIQTAELNYSGRYGHKWLYYDWTLRQDGRAAFLDTPQKTLYFQNYEVGCKFLADYVSTQKPNYAMLRKR